MAERQGGGVAMSLAEATEIAKTPKLLRDLLGMAEIALSKAMVDMKQEDRPQQAGMVLGVRMVRNFLRQADQMVREANRQPEDEVTPEIAPVGLVQLLLQPVPVENKPKTGGG